MSARGNTPVYLFDLHRVARGLRRDRTTGIGPFPWGPAADKVFSTEYSFWKDLDCPSYSDCLGVAAHYNWNNMTCAGCKLSRARPLMETQDE